MWDRDHDRHVVNQLLAKIAPDFQPITWRAFRAFVLEEKPASQVAAELGISEGAVWTAKSHVLKRLRQEAGHWID
jgi:RNA polymerase sigma-70 factor (ECF subfamily)